MFRVSFLAIGVAALFLTGCGSEHSITEQAAQATPTNEIHVLSVTQRTHLASNPARYEGLALSLATGKKITVSVKQQPLIFFSPNLGGQALLQELAQVHVSPTPLLISTGFPSTFTQQQAVAETQELVSQTHISWPIVYDFTNPFGTVISGLPDTYVWKNGHVWEIPGALPHAAQWQKAL
ncbi:hypothetical protein BM613_13025 [Sulfoacidibacillus thermotolerans]|uniref:Uncharacterized protein n=1 Tax=Sulfoacidibacillus thermotolerans TaxID=1765684 RepID=A0A2U3D5L5_SULT2|nr:hypothetical protein BM613_13025 [Sulfoacidibacillus thermotolerans]